MKLRDRGNELLDRATYDVDLTIAHYRSTSRLAGSNLPHARFWLASRQINKYGVQLRSPVAELGDST